MEGNLVINEICKIKDIKLRNSNGYKMVEEYNADYSFSAYEAAPNFIAPRFSIPRELLMVLKSNLKILPGMNQLCRDYIECIKSLQTLPGPDSENYFYIYKLFLFIETYEKILQESIKYEKVQVLKPNNNVFNSFIVDVSNASKDDIVMKVSGPVKLYYFKPNKKWGHEYVDVNSFNLESKTIIIYVGNEKVAEYIRNGANCYIKFMYKDIHMNTCHNALHSIYNCNLFSCIFPKVAIQRIHIFHEPLSYQSTMNQEQQKAVQSILFKTAHPAPFILFGPPGTGKTATLVEAIYQIYSQDSSNHVLVCTSSNSASDELCCRLVKIISTNCICRIYGLSRNWNNVPTEILPCSNFIEKEPVLLPKEIFNKKRIVIITLGSSMKLMGYDLKKDYFSHIFIDEASQSIEPETLIPFVLAAEENSTDVIKAQIVIAGDPHQLGPVTFSPITRRLLGIPMMERLMATCTPYKKSENGNYNSIYIQKLVNNYRSHEKILHVSNKLFYENELKACATDVHRAINWSELPNPNFPIIFHSVRGFEKTEDYSKSLYNGEEIEIVFYYLKKLVNVNFGDSILQEKDIAIVTPFKQQELKIKNLLQEKQWSNILVGTVELLQGKERPVVIFTTVRSSILTIGEKKHLGHLSNPKRFNVALTRAQSLFILIGHPDVLKIEPFWVEFMQYCLDNNACCGESFILNENKYDKNEESDISNHSKI